MSFGLRLKRQEVPPIQVTISDHKEVGQPTPLETERSQ